MRSRIRRPPAQRIRAVAQPQTPAELLYRLAPGVALTVRDETVKLTGGAAALQLELGLDSLAFVTHFATPHTLSSVLLQPGLDAPQAMLHVAAVVRELLAMGALAAVQPIEPSNGEIWSQWDSALDFYLATRTSKQTAFSSLDQMDEVLLHKADERPQPSAYKDYNAHPFFPLPNPLLDGPEPQQASGFLDVLLRRRSLRDFTAAPLSTTELSALLYYVWGATGVLRNPLGDVFLRKTSPGGGSLHGAEVYPLLMNVEGFEPGLYHYSVRRHGLVLLSREQPRSWVAQACGDQIWVADAAAAFLTTYNVKRLAWKYAYSRGFRAALLDTGHIGQSFALVATWMGLAPFTTAALRDEMFEEKLGLDYRSELVFMINGVGHPADALLLPDRPRTRAE